MYINFVGVTKEYDKVFAEALENAEFSETSVKILLDNDFNTADKLCQLTWTKDAHVIIPRLGLTLQQEVLLGNFLQHCGPSSANKGKCSCTSTLSSL